MKVRTRARSHPTTGIAGHQAVAQGRVKDDGAPSQSPIAKTGDMCMVGRGLAAPPSPRWGHHGPGSSARDQGRSGLDDRVAIGGKMLVQQRIERGRVQPGWIDGWSDRGKSTDDHIKHFIVFRQPGEGVGVDDLTGWTTRHADSRTPAVRRGETVVPTGSPTRVTDCTDGSARFRERPAPSPPQNQHPMWAPWAAMAGRPKALVIAGTRHAKRTADCCIEGNKLSPALRNH